MSTQKNRLNETVVLSTQNICLKVIQLQLYAENVCLNQCVMVVKTVFFNIADVIRLESRFVWPSMFTRAARNFYIHHALCTGL